MSQIVTLLLLALLSLGNAQLLSNPRRIYNNTDGTYNVKVMGAAMTACSQTVVVMDDSPQCFKYLNMDGVVYDWACTPEMALAFDMVIYASAGYAITTDGRLIVLDMYSGDPIDVVGEAEMRARSPWKVGLYTSFAVPTLTHTWVLADNATNSTIYGPNWTITNTGENQYGSYLIVQLTNTRPIKCFFSPIGGQFMLTYEGGNEVYVYSWSRSTDSPANKLLRTLTGFGEIGACGGDYYNRVWIWDKGCNCLKVLTPTGTILYTVPLPDVVNPKNIQPTRNKVFIHDDIGIIRYDLPPLQATFTPPEPQTCASTGSTLRMTALGGSPPYTARVVPDIISGTSANIIASFSWEYTTTGARYREPYTTTYTLYDDEVSPEFELWASAGGVMNPSVPASVIPPQSGDNSWGMLMARGYQYALRVSTTLPGGTISASFFSRLEMWINVGNGPAGAWRIDMTNGNSQGNYQYFDYYPGDFPLNTWVKFSLDLSLYGPSTYPRIVFADYSGLNSDSSFIYIDNIRLIPYNSSDLLLVMRDFCNVTILSPYYTSWRGNKLLKASVVSDSVSCAASEATHSNQTNDGALNAVVTGGILPYTYAWSFTGSSSSTLSGLAPFSDNIPIYDNQVRSDFQDFSSGPHNPSDTTHYLSAPSSYSLDPSGSTSALVFFTPQGIDASQYQSINFWVHGGETGGQIIYAALISEKFDTYNPTLIHRTMIPPIPTVPAGGWTKASYPLNAGLGTFYGFVLSPMGGKLQPRIYFDDIEIMSNTHTLTVTDSASCKVSTNGLKVSIPDPLTLAPSVSHATCYGGQGTVNVNATGGTAPYSYAWTGTTATTGTASGLPQGQYSVSVTDARGCKPKTASIEVIQPSAISVVSSVTPAKCYGGNGTLTVRATGGTPAHTYAWSSSSPFLLPQQPAPLAIFTDTFHLQGSFSLDVGAGAEIACARGALAAQSGLCALLVTPPSLPATLLSIGCPGCIDFSLFTTIRLWINLVDSVNPQLTAVFTTGATTVFEQALNTPAESGWKEIVITLPASGVADKFSISKNGANAGRFLIDTISIVPKSILSDGTGVAAGFASVVEGAAGNYTLTVTDGNTCSSVNQFFIPQPTAINITFTITHPKERKSNGKATAVVSGGTPPYAYYWPELNKNTSSVSNLGKGSYTVVVADANGCAHHAVAVLGSGSAAVSAFLSLLAIAFAVVAQL